MRSKSFALLSTFAMPPTWSRGSSSSSSAQKPLLATASKKAAVNKAKSKPRAKSFVDEEEDQEEAELDKQIRLLTAKKKELEQKSQIHKLECQIRALKDSMPEADGADEGCLS